MGKYESLLEIVSIEEILEDFIIRRDLEGLKNFKIDLVKNNYEIENLELTMFENFKKTVKRMKDFESYDLKLYVETVYLYMNSVFGNNIFSKLVYVNIEDLVKETSYPFRHIAFNGLLHILESRETEIFDKDDFNRYSKFLILNEDEKEQLVDTYLKFEYKMSDPVKRHLFKSVCDFMKEDDIFERYRWLPKYDPLLFKYYRHVFDTDLHGFKDLIYNSEFALLVLNREEIFESFDIDKLIKTELFDLTMTLIQKGLYVPNYDEFKLIERCSSLKYIKKFKVPILDINKIYSIVVSTYSVDDLFKIYRGRIPEFQSGFFKKYYKNIVDNILNMENPEASIQEANMDYLYEIDQTSLYNIMKYNNFINYFTLEKIEDLIERCKKGLEINEILHNRLLRFLGKRKHILRLALEQAEFDFFYNIEEDSMFDIGLWNEKKKWFSLSFINSDSNKRKTAFDHYMHLKTYIRNRV